jgi:hypothetical protein
MRTWLPAAAAALLAAAVATPSLVRAQSLAEIAEKEKERRKAAKKPAKTYTEADLKRGGISTFNAQVGEAPAAAPAPEGDASPAPEAGASPAPAQPGQPGAAGAGASASQRAEQERRWRERLKQAEDRVAAITTQIQRLEAALNDQTTPQYGVARTNMTNELAQAREQLGAAKLNLETVQAEGRQNGFR